MTSNFKFNFASIITTFFGVGNIKFAPGTFGSLATIPLFFLINYCIVKAGIDKNYFFVLGVYLFDLIVLFLLAMWSITVYINVNKKDDPSECVIDEVIGQLIAYIIPILVSFETTALSNFIFILFPFFLFRFFDIKKPSLVGYFDKNFHNAFGIIMDDVIAGIYSGVCVAVLLKIV
ncbi:MAG: phosphatidylglycerophosphatase A [Rickettsiales bacterium]|jgi:phosphatidylglycerophosphatase A|nr:phosphatidylglycerophosphatase A [Rickettsiales bacterium]